MWQVNIEVLNISQQRVHVVVIRTDTITGAVYTAKYTGIIETPTQRSHILDQIKNDYLEYLERQEQADTVIAGLEATATNALNDWEETL